MGCPDPERTSQDTQPSHHYRWPQWSGQQCLELRTTLRSHHLQNLHHLKVMEYGNLLTTRKWDSTSQYTYVPIHCTARHFITHDWRHTFYRILYRITMPCSALTTSCITPWGHSDRKRVRRPHFCKQRDGDRRSFTFRHCIGGFLEPHRDWGYNETNHIPENEKCLLENFFLQVLQIGCDSQKYSHTNCVPLYGPMRIWWWQSFTHTWWQQSEIDVTSVVCKWKSIWWQWKARRHVRSGALRAKGSSSTSGQKSVRSLMANWWLGQKGGNYNRDNSPHCRWASVVKFFHHRMWQRGSEERLNQSGKMTW